MPAHLLHASIRRHLPFLTPAESKQLGASTAERNATERCKAIAHRMGARLPGAAGSQP